MDTKVMEQQALNYVKSTLIQYHFDLGELSFDKNGTDLYLIKHLSNTDLRYLRIQCKGRNLSTNKSNVRIPNNYLMDNFILFLYVIRENNIKLLCFFSDEIAEWKRNKKGEHTLNLNSNIYTKGTLDKHCFDLEKVNRMNNLFIKSKEYTNVIIDGISLEKQISETVKVYKNIFPNKVLHKPNLETLIKNILLFYKFPFTTQKIINCKLFLSSSFSLEEIIEINFRNSIINIGNLSINLYFHQSEDFIVYIISEEIQRTIEKENIILVSNELILQYEYSNQITVLTTRDKLSKYNKWGDIAYPIAMSIGINKSDL